MQTSQRRRLEPGQRQRIMERDRFTCHYCGRSGSTAFNGKPYDPNGRDWAIDHRNPVVRGGDNDDSNLVLACWLCNTSKGATPYDVFIARGTS